MFLGTTISCGITSAWKIGSFGNILAGRFIMISGLTGIGSGGWRVWASFSMMSAWVLGDSIGGWAGVPDL